MVQWCAGDTEYRQWGRHEDDTGNEDDSSFAGTGNEDDSSFAGFLNFKSLKSL